MISVLVPLAGCSSGGDKSTTSKAAISIRPATGTKNVTPGTPVVVRASNGTLSAVTVSAAGATAVTGTLSADKVTWTSSGTLGYDKTYSVTATAADKRGRTAKATGSFTTLKPTNLTLPRIIPNGGTWGIGKPIEVLFDEPIKDRAAAERTLVVTTTPHVDGAWHWFSSKEVHWRPGPTAYWPAHTHVSVQANVVGVDLGGGLYGQANRTGNFDIGDSHLAVADDNTHQMQVFVNGTVVKTIPISMGQHKTIQANGKTFDLHTHSGPHVVTEKFEVKRMTSGSWGLTDPQYSYDSELPWAVRISDSGEFVHENAATVAAQGNRDVSHGCINVSPANAKWFYDLAMPGDVVDVRNTGGPVLDVADGLGDWTMSWADWTAGSAQG